MAPPKEQDELMSKVITDTINRGGKILMPVLGSGRAQELIVLAHKLIQEGKIPEIPIFIDGMVWDMTAIHTAYPEYFNSTVRQQIFHKDNNPFLMPNIKRIKGAKERQQVLERHRDKPCLGRRETLFFVLRFCYKPFIFCMTVTRQKKEEVVAKIKDAAHGAESIVFVNFHGLGVSDTNELRSALREEGVSYTVARKTLIRLALSEAKFEGEMPELPGEVAIAYGSDPVLPASKIAHFAKKHKEKISILGGVFEGKFMDKVGMETIASIPSMPVLRGMFVNVINSPIAGLVVALDAIADKKMA